MVPLLFLVSIITFIIIQLPPGDFFDSLMAFMSSGPCVVMVLEGPDAIGRYRDLMGATDYTQAAEGTIRRDFATDIEKNVVHGSDSPETAAFEIGYFFSELEITA